MLRGAGTGMLACGRNWQPVSVNRVIESFESSTCVVRVATDAGICFIKGMGNPAGNESLAHELVGSELAALLGLTVPAFAIVDVAGIEIPLKNGGTLNFGPAFVSRELRGSPAEAGDTFVRRLVNPSHVPLLVAFDTWVRNLDRCPPANYLDPTPNRDNLFFTPVGRRFEMIVFDHTHCFVEGDLESGLTGTQFVEDARIYGAFPEFMPLLSEASLRAAGRAVAHVDAATVRAIVKSIPDAWGPGNAIREGWADQILARAGRIEEYLLAGLIPQLQLKV